MEIESIQLEPISADVESNHHTSIKKLPTQIEIQTWIVNYLAELLEVKSDRIDVTIPFDRYGLDSSAAVGLTGDLGDWLETEIDPTLLYDYPTVEALVEHLSRQTKS